jgi:integrase
LRPRGTGSVYQRPGRSGWYIKYYDAHGRAHRESAGSEQKAVAERLLKRRLSEVRAGKALVGAALERSTTFAELRRLIVDDYRVAGRKSLPSVEQSFRALARAFEGWRACDIGYSDLSHYAAQRLESCKPATVRRELGLLRRSFVLAKRAQLVAETPAFPTVAVGNNARTGFFEPEQWRAVRAHLAPHYQDACDFAYLTGWRVMEVFGLRWAEVAAGAVRLAGSRTKNGWARTFPFGALPELEALLQRRRTETQSLARAAGRIVPWVFHDGAGGPLFSAGQAKKSFRRAWRRACRAAGLPDRIPHDFRRTAVRNLDRAGVARSVAMELVGHRTESVYQRYNIVAERELTDGVKIYAAALAAPGAGTKTGTK